MSMYLTHWQENNTILKTAPNVILFPQNKDILLQTLLYQNFKKDRREKKMLSGN